MGELYPDDVGPGFREGWLKLIKGVGNGHKEGILWEANAHLIEGVSEKRKRKYPEHEQPAMPRKDRILSLVEGTESLLTCQE